MLIYKKDYNFYNARPYTVLDKFNRKEFISKYLENAMFSKAVREEYGIAQKDKIVFDDPKYSPNMILIFMPNIKRTNLYSTIN